MSGPAPIQLSAVVHGRVQGVFFRAWTRETATELGLSGWVRNRPDGAVEISAQGDQADLEELLRLCHQGPPSARVERVEANWESPSERYASFSIRH